MIKFDVYIKFNKNIRLSESVVAYVVHDYIPNGTCNERGEEILNSNTDYFINLNDLSLYFCDWCEIIENEDMIVADVYFEKYSNKKRRKGKEIVTYIDKIAKEN